MAKPAYLSVKNYEKYQHYKDRNPPWIKLYWDLLADDKFVMLTMADRGLYCHFLLLASRHSNCIPFDIDYIQLQLKLLARPDLTRLLHDKFLLARCKRGASKTLDESALPRSEIRDQSSERELEKEEEKITSPVGDSTSEVDSEFETFWEAYPERNGKRIGKAKAKVLFRSLSASDRESCLVAVKNYSTSKRVGEGFIRDAERFLKANFWREWIEPETPQAITPKPQRFSPTAAAMAKVRELEALQRG